MSDYTPTTEYVREEFTYGAQDLDMDGNVVVSFVEAGAQFDRWLARERAAVWDEVVATIRRCDPKCIDDCDLCVFRGDVLADITPNPYREGER